MFLFKKPSLFISYSRQDESLAAFLYNALSVMGYEVFYDREGILVGENFAERIQQSVKSTDAFIFIISDNSIQSKWCKAEVYTSIAMNKRLIPIRFNNNSLDLLENYVLFPKNLNYVDIKDDRDFQNSVDKIHKMLFSTRRKHFVKKIKIMAFILLLIAVGYIALNTLSNKINQWNFEKKKVEISNRVKSASKIFNSEQIEKMARRLLEMLIL
ncbi:MAG: toll/interleukin-1 receptor domain-containing protein [Lewinellaceae bacterium]|nr:toll/interleukin-1 receptor domain-containing protein [Lewinellaceae bacterium]